LSSLPRDAGQKCGDPRGVHTRHDHPGITLCLPLHPVLPFPPRLLWRLRELPYADPHKNGGSNAAGRAGETPQRPFGGGFHRQLLA